MLSVCVCVWVGCVEQCDDVAADIWAFLLGVRFCLGLVISLYIMLVVICAVCTMYVCTVCCACIEISYGNGMSIEGLYKGAAGAVSPTVAAAATADGVAAGAMKDMLALGILPHDYRLWKYYRKRVPDIDISPIFGSSISSSISPILRSKL